MAALKSAIVPKRRAESVLFGGADFRISVRYPNDSLISPVVFNSWCTSSTKIHYSACIKCWTISVLQRYRFQNKCSIYRDISCRISKLISFSWPSQNSEQIACIILHIRNCRYSFGKNDQGGRLFEKTGKTVKFLYRNRWKCSRKRHLSNLLEFFPWQISLLITFSRSPRSWNGEYFFGKNYQR